MCKKGFPIIIVGMPITIIGTPKIIFGTPIIIIGILIAIYGTPIIIFSLIIINHFPALRLIYLPEQFFRRRAERLAGRCGQHLFACRFS